MLLLLFYTVYTKFGSHFEACYDGNSYTGIKSGISLESRTTENTNKCV